MKMNHPRLTIIIPVYNTRAYLADCLLSVARQTLDNIEVILVNDGSTDGSEQVLKEWVHTDKRFYYIEQENKGLSVARNRGMSMAHGRWVAFLDSDDWLYSDDCMSQLCRIAERESADMIAGNTWSVYADGRKSLWGQHAEKAFISNETLSGGEYFVRTQKYGCYIPMVYHYLYSRDFLSKQRLRFEPGIIHEDELWTPQALTLAGRVTYTDISHYCYRQREGSIMTGAKVGLRIASLQTIIERLLEYTACYTNDCIKAKRVKEALHVNILRLYRTVCTLTPSNKYATIYDKSGSMLAICDELTEWLGIKEQYYVLILHFIKEYFNQLQEQCKNNGKYPLIFLK